jgi:DNA replication protein DnaC
MTNNRHNELAGMLSQLHLGAIGANFSNLALKATKEQLSHEAFLYELVRLECEQRSERRIQKRLTQSKLPREKTFATFDRDRLTPALRLQLERLQSEGFVKSAKNVVAVGAPGAGKSHLAAALGHQLIEQGYTVLWSSTAALVQRLLAAKRDLKLPQELAKLNRIDCVILDDIGYVQHERDEMEVLFTFLAERYERKSVIITTNLVFSEWERIFKDPLTTMAAIDRVVHHSIVFDMLKLESYRAKQAELHQSKVVPPVSPSKEKG